MSVERTTYSMALVEDLFTIVLLFILWPCAHLELACASSSFGSSLLAVEELDLVTASLVVDYILVALVLLILKDLDLRAVRAVGRLKQNTLHYLLYLNLCRADVLEMIGVQVTHLWQGRQLIHLAVCLMVG